MIYTCVIQISFDNNINQKEIKHMIKLGIKYVQLEFI